MLRLNALGYYEIGLIVIRNKRNSFMEYIMKNCSKVLLISFMILGFNNTCLANSLLNIFSTFQRDVEISVLYENHKNLIQGSKVYLAENPKGQKVLIGEVKKISLVEPQSSNVEVIVDKKYKDKIYETMPFVLMSGLSSEDSKSYIVVISSLKPSNKTPLKSGSSVKGLTFLEYKIATAGEELIKLLGSLKKQNNEFLNQLEQYIEDFNTEAFQKRMNHLINKISEFSSEQKETFKNEILPPIREAFESMMEKLKEKNNTDKSKELKKQLMEIEDIVNV